MSDDEREFDYEGSKEQREQEWARKKFEMEKIKAFARMAAARSSAPYDPQKQKLEFELRSMSPDERKRKLEEIKAKEKRDAENQARFEQMQKDKAREKRQSDKAELKEKQTRGIMDLKSFFKDGKIQARGRIDNVMREVKPAARKIVAVEKIVDEKPIAPKVYVALPVGSLEEGDCWVTEEEVCGDPMMERAFRELTTQTVRGCANQVQCNSNECAHEEDIPVSVLEELMNSSRPKKSDRVISSFVHMNPFLDINFPLRDKMPKLTNKANDTTLCSVVRNNDSTLCAAMTSAEPPIEDIVVNLRRSYQQELASLHATYEKTRLSYAETTAQYREYILSLNDRSALHFLDERAEQNYENLVQELKNNIERMDLSYQHHLMKKLSESRQNIFFSRGITIRALMDILRLKDGRRRDDVYYRQLANDVATGLFNNLEREVARENCELGFADRPRTPPPQVAKTDRELENEAFLRRVQHQRVKTLHEREKEKAELVRIHDQDIDPETQPKRARKSSPETRPPPPPPPPPVAKVHSSTRSPIDVEEPERKTWHDLALSSSHVCKAQERPACTPIAFMAALRFAMLRDPSDKNVRAMGFERNVDTGTKLWERWKKSNPDVEYMLAEDVKNDSINEMMQKNGLISFECAGPWGAVSKKADREIFKQLEEWLPIVKAKAHGDQFGAVLTVRAKTIAIARCAGKYYVFDSHGVQSSLLCFDNMDVLIEALHLRFDGTVEEEQALYNALPKTPLAIESAFSFTMYAIYKPIE